MSKPYLNGMNECIRLQLRGHRIACLKFFQPKLLPKSDLRSFAERISKIFGRAFWHSDDPEKRWTVDKIMQRLPKMQCTVLALSNKAIGYAMFDSATYDDHKILFVDSIGIVPDWQHSGLGIKILFEVLKHMPCASVAARTQNPAFILMLRKLEPQALLPLTACYEGHDLELLKALKREIIELKGANIDLRSGLCRKAYHGKKLGDYEVNLSNSQINQIESRFEQLGLNRDDSDAIVVIAKNIKEPVQQV